MVYYRYYDHFLQLYNIGGIFMPKDSQPDNKKDRKRKSKGQTPLTEENHNHNPNAKKQSIKNNDV